MPETNPVPIINGVIINLFNNFRPLPIVIKKTQNNITELPFGWGDGEPPTPEDEEPSTLDYEEVILETT
jgi:hypothetical protein